MSARLLPFILISIFFDSGCSSAPPGKPMAVEDLFPLEDGRIHSFNITPGGRSASMTLEGIGQGYWGLDFWAGSGDRFMLGLVRDPSGLGIVAIGMGHGAMPLDPPLLLIPSMVVEGVPWSSRAAVGGKRPEIQAELARHPEAKSVEFSAHGSEAAMSITAGGKAYQARMVELRVSGKNPQSRRDDRVLWRLWIAPSVGIVKVEVGEKGPDDRSPMQTWELAEIKRKP